MIWVYKAVDLISTVAEVVVCYRIVACFCKGALKEITRKWRRYLPCLCLLVEIYLLTWHTQAGEYKPLIEVLTYAVIAAVCYRENLITTIIPSMISMIMLLMTESLMMIIYQLMTGKNDVTVIINGQVLITWEIYVGALVIRGVITYLFIKIFKNFEYALNWRDLLLVLFDFIIVIWVYAFNFSSFFSGDDNFFNLTQHIIYIFLSLGVLLPVFYLKNYYYLREKTRKDKVQIEQLQAQYAYYQDKRREEERVRGIYHDLKNHLLILQKQPGNSRSVQNSVLELEKQIEGYENYFKTGNDFLDIIIRDKARIAKEKQIDFNVVVHFEAGAFIEPLDISTIFGNALDNAIEASEKLSISKRMITIKAAAIRDMLIVIVENNMADEKLLDKRTAKEDIFLHGFGLSNIKKAVAKYDGQCNTEIENGMFKLKIVIPMLK